MPISAGAYLNTTFWSPTSPTRESDGLLHGLPGFQKGFQKGLMGDVPFCFAPHVPDDIQALLRVATKRFTAMIPCVTFREVATKPLRHTGELVQCVEAPALLVTSTCAGDVCKCGPVWDKPSAAGMRVLNLLEGCLLRDAVVHEIGHVLGTPWKEVDGNEKSNFGVSLKVPENVFVPNKHRGILTGISKLIWEWVWTPAALNSLDIDQLKQMYEMEAVGSHPPLRGGPRCLDIPRNGVDVCIQLSDANCEASEDITWRCCVCGGGLRIQCPVDGPRGPWPGPEKAADGHISEVEVHSGQALPAPVGGVVLVSAGSVPLLLALVALVARSRPRHPTRLVMPTGSLQCE
jgi:hypothetical protein